VNNLTDQLHKLEQDYRASQQANLELNQLTADMS